MALPPTAFGPEYDDALERLIALGYVVRTTDPKGAPAIELTDKGRELGERIALDQPAAGQA